MQSLSFIQMMRAMMYSGAIVNYVLFCPFIAYVWHRASCHPDRSGNGRLRYDQTESFLFMGFFFIAAGVKLAILNITGIPFIAAGFMLMKQKKQKTAWRRKESGNHANVSEDKGVV